MIELIPFVLIGLIILLGVLLILEVQKQVRPQKPKPKSSPVQKEKAEGSELGLLLLILGASWLARILSSTTVLASPAASILLVLLIVGIVWYIFNQNTASPDKPQYQRVPVSPDVKDEPSPDKPRYRRVPISSPKRNDWKKRHLDRPLPPLNQGDWKPPKRNREPWFNRVANTFSSSPIQRANPKQQELLSLLNGDRDTAQRLLSHVKQSNPGQPETWYFEKVISDILRDRR